MKAHLKPQEVRGNSAVHGVQNIQRPFRDTDARTFIIRHGQHILARLGMSSLLLGKAEQLLLCKSYSNRGSELATGGRLYTRRAQRTRGRPGVDLVHVLSRDPLCSSIARPEKHLSLSCVAAWRPGLHSYNRCPKLLRH
jgi:hypothetical protein